MLRSLIGYTLVRFYHREGEYIVMSRYIKQHGFKLKNHLIVQIFTAKNNTLVEVNQDHSICQNLCLLQINYHLQIQNHQTILGHQ